MTRYPVPEIFQQPDKFLYPSDNFPDFEYWFMHGVTDDEIRLGDRVYLPILFTSYFKNNLYGKNQSAIDHLQRFVDTLPTDLKYFCVVQFDDGVLIDFKGKDVMVFAMSGKPDNCVPIPLVCQQHKFKFHVEKDIILSFVGRVTDPARQVILDWSKMQSNRVYVTSSPHSLEEYCRVLARSKYVLCPRGYGASSFRIAEAYQYGAYPVIMHRIEDRVFPCPVSNLYSYESLEPRDLTYLMDGIGRWMPNEKFEGSIEKGRMLYTFEGVKQLIKQGLCQIP